MVHWEGRQRVLLEGDLEEGSVVQVLNNLGLLHNVGEEAVVDVEEVDGGYIDRIEGSFEAHHRDFVALVGGLAVHVVVEGVIRMLLRLENQV